MENISPEVTEDQYVTYISGEVWERNEHVRHSKPINKYPYQYDPCIGAARQCNIDYITILVYIIFDWGYNSNIDTDKNILLLAEWDS